jgi:hypothetical protein
MNNVYKNMIQNLVSLGFVKFISRDLLVILIDVFCAYFAESNFKVIHEIYRMQDNC